MTPVKVSDGQYVAANKYSRTLINYYKLSCQNEKNSCIYVGELSSYKMKQLKKFCKSKKIKFEINNKYGKRSSAYRDIFYKNVKPVIPNRYFCAYCGRFLKISDVTVDHLYPVGEVNKSIKLQDKLKKIGAKSVNDYQNLVPACRKCNIKKGKKMGYWIFKGQIGRNQKVWLIIWPIRILLLAAFIMLVIVLYGWFVLQFLS